VSIAKYGQRAGLALINGLARSVPHHRETISFGDDPRQRLDWYRLGSTGKSAGLRPTVLFYYGGNWRSGKRQDYRFVADTLMTFGCDVVIPDYRLYPDFRFSDIITDAELALAAVLPVIPKGAPFFLMGHSAGAQLGALLTLNLRRRPFFAHEGAHEGADPVNGFIGLSGPYDFSPYTEDDHWDLFAPEDHYRESQPVNFVRSHAPPLYLLHGEDDQRVRRGHSKSLMEKQLAAGGEASREVYPGLGHVDIMVQFSRLYRGRSPVVRDVAAFIQRCSESSHNPASSAAAP
jgi:acetyl esterase/lipase